MELLNAINKYQGLATADLALLRSVTEDLLC